VIASPTATLAESSSSALIKTLVILLGVLGIVMAIVTVWLVRSTRPDRALLGRLEVMGTRQWRKASTSARQRGLETVPTIVREPTPSGGVERPAFDDSSADAAEPAPDVVEPETEIEESSAEIEAPVPDVTARDEADTADPAQTADADDAADTDETTSDEPGDAGAPEKAPAAAAGDSDD